MTTLFINQKEFALELQGHETLIEVLRDKLGLTGTKHSCSEGECGSCTVLLNGRPVLSCMLLAADLDRAEITTIEGIADADNLSPLQQAFLEEGAVQCGFCTPGMVLAAQALLGDNPHPTIEQIKSALDGNICRCGGYLRIFKAVQKVFSKEK